MHIYATKDVKKKLYIPLYASLVQAGFPSPADDYIHQKLDLNEYLVDKPSSTFFVKVEGESMIGAGIFPNDLLIVDRSKTVKENDVILAILEGEFTVKRFKTLNGKVYLSPENKLYQVIEVTKDMDFEVWGVVTNVIHKP
jgi:DNA polymerase V